MNCISKTVICSILIGLTITPINAGDRQSVHPDHMWQRLSEGLELGIFFSPLRSEVGDSTIRVLRIDPQRYEFKLFNTTSSDQGRTLTAKEWCQRNDLVAAINASMYQTDHKTSVSLMLTDTHTNNPRLSKDMTILAFDRQSHDVPLVKIIDRQCEDFQTWKNKYGTLVQSIRMISCKGKNVWTQQPKKWSTAAIAIDNKGKILFIHARSPYSTHDFINILQMLALDISRAMYAEGGPEAQMYIKAGGHEFEFIGSFDSNFNNSNENVFTWPIPNVVGIRLRKSTTE